MRRKIFWRAAICVALVFGGGALSPTDLGFVGVGQAEAKEYYTRKRVNGKWITGRFPKKSFAKKESASRSARRGAAVARSAEAAPAKHVPVPPVKAEPAAQAAPAPQSTALAYAPRSATGVTLVPLSEDERLNKLREALRARANALTTGSIAPAPAAAPAPEPQSVSLDFRSGTKTTIFSDGTLVTEPFDVGLLKGIAGAFPGSAAGPRPAQ